MPGRGIRVLERFAVIRLKIIYASARVKRREIRNEKAKREARRIPGQALFLYYRFPLNACGNDKFDARPRPEASALPRTFRPRSQGVPCPAMCCDEMFWIVRADIDCLIVDFLVQ